MKKKIKDRDQEKRNPVADKFYQPEDVDPSKKYARDEQGRAPIIEAAPIMLGAQKLFRELGWNRTHSHIEGNTLLEDREKEITNKEEVTQPPDEGLNEWL